MKPVQGLVWGLAVLCLGATANSAEAAWCNVFQVCWHRQRASTSNYYAAASPAAACCDPCPPQPVCTTRYVQRCYYQPVTSYVSKSYYEPVTTYQTSYYYEPVTSYKYSCYYDPCTCSYQQVAQPCTSYRLRSQCCPVQSWVQRCCSVPVTSYQQSFYYEPVTSCCTPTSYASASPPCDPATQAPAPAPAPSYGSGPGISEGRMNPSPAAPGVTETPKSSGQYDRYYPQPQTAQPPTSGSSRPLPPYPQAQPRVNPQAPPPQVRLDSIVFGGRGRVEGQVVRADRLPASGTKVTFVSLDKPGTQQAVMADGTGRFQLSLVSGSWRVYLDDGRGQQPEYHSRVDLGVNENKSMMLVSR